MTSLQAILQIENGLNKLSSSDYQNIPAWKMEEAVNIEVVNMVRRKLPKKETTTKDVDDLQVLLKTKTLAGINKNDHFISNKLPSDYFGYSRVTPICNKGNCKTIKIPSSLLEDGNVDELLTDYNSSPSFDFEQCFHILADNRVKVYHNNDFEVKEITLNYYKRPQYITFPGQGADGTLHKDMVWEFKDDVAGLIIEGAIKLLAVNIESINRAQFAQQELQNNN